MRQLVVALARVPGAGARHIAAQAHGAEGRATGAARPLQRGHARVITHHRQRDDLDHRVTDGREVFVAPELIVVAALVAARVGGRQQHVSRLGGAHQAHVAHVVFDGLHQAEPLLEQAAIAPAQREAAAQIGELGLHQVRRAPLLAREEVLGRRARRDVHQAPVGHPRVVDPGVRVLGSTVADEAGAVAVLGVGVAAHVQHQGRALAVHQRVDTLGDRVVDRATEGQTAARADARGREAARRIHAVIAAVREVAKADARVAEAAQHRDLAGVRAQVAQAPLGVAEDAARDAVGERGGGVERARREGVGGQRPEGAVAAGVACARVEGAQVEAVGCPHEHRAARVTGHGLGLGAAPEARRKRKADREAAEASQEATSSGGHGASWAER